MKYNEKIERAKDSLRTAFVREWEATIKAKEEADMKLNSYQGRVNSLQDQLIDIAKDYEKLFGENLEKAWDSMAHTKNDFDMPVPADGYEPVASFNSSGEVRPYDSHYPNYPKKVKRP